MSDTTRIRRPAGIVSRSIRALRSGIVPFPQLFFHQQQARHLRLYYEWDQHSSINEVVSEINHFDHINITLQGDSIIIK